jgi:hypothetical protein
MSSTMQMYRTAVSVAKADFYTALNDLLENYAFALGEGEMAWVTIDTSTDQVDYKLSNDLFLRVKKGSGNVYVCMVKNNTETSTEIITSNYCNATVFKVNHCVALSVNSLASPLTAYSYTAKTIIDSINSGDGFAIVGNMTGGAGTSAGTATVYDTTNNGQNTNVYIPYTGYSYKQNTSTLQIAPYINNNNGAQFDNLKAILITPINTAGFVSFNNQIWWLNNGYFALPAGDREPSLPEITPS